MREPEPREFGAIVGIDLRARPLVALDEQAAAVGGDSAPDVDHAARRRTEMAAEEHRDLAAARGLRWTLGENVGAALHRGRPLIEQDAVVVRAIVARDRGDCHGGEGREARPVAQPRVQAEVEGRAEGGGGMVREKLKSRASGGRQGERSGDIGSRMERGRFADECRARPRLDGCDVGLSAIEPEPAADRETKRIHRCAGGGSVEVGG